MGIASRTRGSVGLRDAVVTPRDGAFADFLTVFTVFFADLVGAFFAGAFLDVDFFAGADFRAVDDFFLADDFFAETFFAEAFFAEERADEVFSLRSSQETSMQHNRFLQSGILKPSTNGVVAPVGSMPERTNGCETMTRFTPVRCDPRRSDRRVMFY